MSLAGIARILGFDREPCWKCMCRCSQRVKRADYTHRQNVSFSQLEWMISAFVWMGLFALACPAGAMLVRI